MVGHGAAHHRPLILPAAGGGKVQRVKKAPAAPGAAALEEAQILHGGPGVDGQGQEGRVRRGDQILVLPPLQRQIPAAAGLVAVAEGGVQGVAGALGDAPGLARKAAVLLDIDAEAAALVQEAARGIGQKQRRHQILEHGARPAGQAPVAVLLQQRPAEPPPVLQRHLPPGHGQVACEHGLACHQVVPAAGAPLLFRVIGDIEEPPAAVVERGEVHLVKELVQPPGKLLLAPAPQRLTQRHEGGAEVAAVHGGDKGGQQRREAPGVVPVVEVPLAAGQALQTVHHARQQTQRRPLWEKAQLHRRGGGQHGKADIGGGAAVGKAEGRLLLEVVRGQIAVLPAAEVPVVAKALLRGGEQIVPLRLGEGALPPGRQRQGEGRAGGEQPQKPHRAPQNRGGEQQAAQPQQDRRPEGQQVGAETALPLLGLGGGLPLEQIFVADRHAPERRACRREADPGLIGQQPEPQEGLHDGAAHPGEQAGKAPRLPRLPAQTLLHQGEQQPIQQRQRRCPGGQRRRAPRQEKARQNGQQGHGRQQRAAQTVKEPPALDPRQIPAEGEGKILPVPPHPAVQALIKAERLGGKGVQELRVPQEAAPQQGALHRVVAQNPSGPDAGGGAAQQGAGVQNALARKAPAAEGVHIQLTAEAAVGVAAPGAGKDQGKVRGGGGGKLCAHPGLQHCVTGSDHTAGLLNMGSVQGVEHGADQLPRGAGVDAGVGVQGQQVARALQRRPVAGDGEGVFLPAAEPGQLQQGAPLALAARPAAPVKAPGAGKEKEAAPVARVQRLDALPGTLQHGFVRGSRLRFRLRQIRQQPEEQVLPLPAAGHALLLQTAALGAGGGGVGQQHRDDAEGLALGRDALFHVHPGQAPGRRQARQKQIQGALHQLGHGDQQQKRRQPPAPGEADQQGEQQRQQQICPDVQPGPDGTGLAEQQPPHMDRLGLGLADQLPRAALLLQPGSAGKLLHPAQIVLPGGAVHIGIVPGGVCAEDGVGEIRAPEKRFRIQHGEEPQGGEERLQQGGKALRLGAVPQFPAEGGQLLQRGAAQGGGEELQLRPAQGRHGLKALQEEPRPRLVHLPPPRQQQRAGQSYDEDPLPAAAQTPCPGEVPGGAALLPAGKIFVVQQPFPGGGQLRRGLAAPPQQGGVAADLLPTSVEGGQGAPAPALTPGRQQPCGGCGAGGELFGFHKGGVPNAFHAKMLLLLWHIEKSFPSPGNSIQKAWCQEKVLDIPGEGVYSL